MGFAMILFAFLSGFAAGAVVTFAWFWFQAEGEIDEMHHDYQQQITDLLKRIRKLEKP